MAAETVWNVFMPKNLVSQRKTYLKGLVDQSECAIYVTGFCDSPVKSEYENIIGDWSPSGGLKTTRPTFDRHHKGPWLDVSQSSGEPLQCHVAHATGVAAYSEKCVFVLFDQYELLSSFILRENIDSEPHVVYHLLSMYSIPRATASTNKSVCRKFATCCMKHIFTSFLAVLTFLFGWLDMVVSVLRFKWLFPNVHIQPPATGSHISYKLHRYRKVLSTTSHFPLRLVLFDASGQQLLDSLLGVTVMGFVMYSGSADRIAQFVVHWADDTAQHLNDLLHWLMGAPAGLKLNAQLTGYLGHFFLYHAYLWKGYLFVLRPVLGWVVWCAAGSGILGVTMQLCLVQDILSMLTIHIYCFYVYASRIYSLQIYALASLWRLFRGKKWNVLRLRVDSALYNMDQLFLGTLLFTVLLFLLPTTALYYFVFASLRLLVLSFHGLLAVCVWCINDIPACSLLLRIIHSKAVTGDVMFTVTDGETADQSLVLTMQATHFPIPKLYKWAQSHLRVGHQLEKKYSWTDILHRLATGSLIYPWVDPVDNDTCSTDKEKTS